MLATVIICTFNRSTSLHNTLKSLETLIVPQDWSWEIIIVHNTSDDDTKKIVSEFTSISKLNIRYVFEKRQGLSNARNFGINEAKGNILVFCDDDMEFDAYWLFHMISVFEQFDCICVAGKIIPKWTCGKPAWLIEQGPYRMASYDGKFDLGNTIQEIRRSPFGGNMAFYKNAFDKYGLFRSDLGRSGNTFTTDEEIELCDRLLSAGERIYYTPKAKVYHLLDMTQAKKSYYIARSFGHGKSYTRTQGVPENTIKVLINLIRQIGRFSETFIKWLFTRNPNVRFYYKVKTYNRAGMTLEYCKIWISSFRRSSVMAKN